MNKAVSIDFLHADSLINHTVRVFYSLDSISKCFMLMHDRTNL